MGYFHSCKQINCRLITGQELCLARRLQFLLGYLGIGRLSIRKGVPNAINPTAVDSQISSILFDLSDYRDRNIIEFDLIPPHESVAVKSEEYAFFVATCSPMFVN
jgi:hypothetical protein